MTDSKIETVQEIYAAFGRGDVETILSKLTDDVDWSTEPSQVIAAWHGRCTGKGEVPRFFEGIGKRSKSPSSPRCRSHPTTPTSS